MTHNNLILGTAVQTILNADYELSIDGILYKFFEGGYIKLNEGDFNKLESLKRDLTFVYSVDNVEIIGENQWLFSLQS
ncbi:MAG: hypothetical protein R3279_09995 [Putridiphycobacter sp.]|nr:hypothetical protein [Putridiphycobacter sp.]